MAAYNVFGIPMTQGSRLERAEVAFNNQNTDLKGNAALAFVRNEKINFGNGVSTLCLFYNATGEELNYIQDYSECGKIYNSYPTRVQNGQWGAYLHIKKPWGAFGSVGYVAYRGKVNDIDYCNLLLGWDTPWGGAQNNHAYCDIFDDGYIDGSNVIYERMEAAGRQHAVTKKRMHITAYIDEGTSPVYEAILSLQH